MGGRGAGHKSERARRARLQNMQKARAARKRAPLPWRSGLESRIIEQLVWQWWNDPDPRKWPAYRVARFLDVSHTWVAKLVKRFRADPDRMRRRMRAFAPADFQKLERARQETRWQRERGWLRNPIRWRRVKYALNGRQSTAIVETKSEAARRRHARAAGASDASGLGTRHNGVRENGSVQNNVQQKKSPFGRAPSNPLDPFAPAPDLPLWARGIVLGP